MSTHVIGSRAPALVRIRPPARVTGTRELVGVGSEGVAGALSLARFDCQKGGANKTGSDCLMCSRYRGWQGGPQGQVTVRCQWSSDDPVWARMTLGCALVTVPPSTDCAAAAELAARAQVRHLVVVDCGHLVGLLSRDDLVPGVPVGARMHEEIFAVDPHATLGEALAAMTDLRIGCLPVVANGLVVGILTRGDLRRAGLDQDAVT